jgi:pseudouridine-5'-phosphate glycosidase
MRESRGSRASRRHCFYIDEGGHCQCANFLTSLRKSQTRFATTPGCGARVDSDRAWLAASAKPANRATSGRQWFVKGRVPATIAIHRWQVNCRTQRRSNQLLANGNDIRKISTRDILARCRKGWNGATTVASTIWIAHRAGIKVFATGGIGGVHRGALPDVSADLPELARTPIVVVCSGAKIVLDLPATREWLETHGVTVVGYQCDELPAFYSRHSGLAIDARANRLRMCLTIFRAQRSLGIESALLVLFLFRRSLKFRRRSCNRS